MHDSARRSGAIRTALGLIVAALLLGVPLALGDTAPSEPTHGEADSDATEWSEYEVKAALLYKISQFITWPEAAFEKETSPIVVAVFGKDPYGKNLDQVLKGKKIGGREVSLERYATYEKIRDCHLLLVPATEMKRLAKIVVAVKGKPVLLFGESGGFASKGGVLNFYLEKKNVLFEVNPEEAKRRGITVSSRLLNMARIVEEESK